MCVSSGGSSRRVEVVVGDSGGEARAGARASICGTNADTSLVGAQGVTCSKQDRKFSTYEAQNKEEKAIKPAILKEVKLKHASNLPAIIDQSGCHITIHTAGEPYR